MNHENNPLEGQIKRGPAPRTSLFWIFCFFFFLGHHGYAHPDSHDSLAKVYLRDYKKYLGGGFLQKITYQAVLPIKENHELIKDSLLKAESAFLLARLHNFLYDKVSSNKYYRDACRIFEQQEAWPAYFRSVQGLSNIYRATKRERRVMPLLNKCLRISKKHDAGISILYIYHELTLLNSYNYNECEKALQFGEVFLDTLESLKSKSPRDRDFIQIDTFIKQSINMEMGRCYVKLGYLDKAEKYLKGVGTYFSGIGEYDKAARVYESIATLKIKRDGNKELVSSFDSLVLNNRKTFQFVYANFRESNIAFRELVKMSDEQRARKIQLKELRQQYFYLFTIFGTILSFFLFGLLYYKNAERNKDKLNRLLEKEMEKSKLLGKEKTRYFAILSHELRTPIYAITGLTRQLLNGQNINRENVDAIINSGNHLLHLVNNVLQHNKLEEADEIKLEEEEFDLSEIINNVLQTTSYLGSQKSIQVKTNVAVNEGNRVIGDRQKLAQILINLVTNAIRYSPDHSTVTLKVNFTKNDDEGQYHFSVSDQGVGLCESQMGTIFRYKETNYSDHDDGNLRGMGIGLYIVSNYLEVMKSKIMVRSTEGLGSEFFFDLSLKAGKTVGKRENSQSFTKSYNILVVDDQNINLIVAKKSVQSLGLACVTAKDTDPVLDILEKNPVDLILMDLNMPVINGFDLSRKIRDHGYSMPILAHTAVLMEHLDPEALRNADMQDFILKPYEIGDLRNKLLLHLEV